MLLILQYHKRFVIYLSSIWRFAWILNLSIFIYICIYIYPILRFKYFIIFSDKNLLIHDITQLFQSLIEQNIAHQALRNLLKGENFIFRFFRTFRFMDSVIKKIFPMSVKAAEFSKKGIFAFYSLNNIEIFLKKKKKQ